VILIPKTVLGRVTVNTRSDACPYLEYKVDIHMGQYNLYHCALEGSEHKCDKHYEGRDWCPVREHQPNKDKFHYIYHDERNTAVYIR
jgi:hypothetical protein